MPRLSVIVPVYNTASYLRRCLDSIMSQDWQDFELILVDDGSTDGSGLLCDEYTALDTRVRVLHQANGGQNAARAAGLSMSQGECIAFVDSDDWVEPYIFAPFMKRLSQEPDTDICVGTMTRDYADGHSERIMAYMPERHFQQAEAIEEMISCEHFRWELVSKIYRRKLLSGLLPVYQGVNAMEDFLWNWNVFHRAKKIYFAPDEAYRYYYNEASVCNTAQDMRWAEAILHMLEGFLSTGPYTLGPNAKRLLHEHLEDDLPKFLARRLLEGAGEKAWAEARAWCARLVRAARLVPQDDVRMELEQGLKEMASMSRQLAALSNRRGAAVYLYGAGKLANLAAAIMQDMGRSPSGCLISDGQRKTQETLCGVPVYFLSDAPVKANDTIILTSAACYDLEICPLLERRGFAHIGRLRGWRDRLERATPKNI